VSCLGSGTPRLKGRVLSVEKTDERMPRETEAWEKCIFMLEITRFSKRTPDQNVPDSLKDRRIKLARYCLYNWHYAQGIEKTLSPEETESLLQGKASSTMFW